MSKYTEDDLKKELETKEYEYGFYTDIESDTLPVGLNEEIIIAISKKKEGIIALESFNEIIHDTGIDSVFSEFEDGDNGCIGLDDDAVYNPDTNPDPNERIKELESLLDQKKAEDGWYYHILNLLGYAHYNNGNKEKAKSYFDEYVDVYPEGYNPHDSMGEYYYNEEDYETSLVHYQKALDNYPMSNSAINKVNELVEKLGIE